jgi:hypothetical protein
MQRANPLAGKTQCRYCGEQISIKSLSTHILTQHARPAQSMAPTLIKKAAPQPHDQ